MIILHSDADKATTLLEFNANFTCADYKCITSSQITGEDLFMVPDPESGINRVATRCSHCRQVNIFEIEFPAQILTLIQSRIQLSINEQGTIIITDMTDDQLFDAQRAITAEIERRFRSIPSLS